MSSSQGNHEATTHDNAGAVGQASLPRTHWRAGVAVRICTRDRDHADASIQSMDLAPEPFHVQRGEWVAGKLPSAYLSSPESKPNPQKLELKHGFFSNLEPYVDAKALFCIHTSAKRNTEISDPKTAKWNLYER